MVICPVLQVLIMHSSQAATAAARHGLSTVKVMSQSLSQGNKEDKQQGLKRTASQAGMSQVQVGKRLLVCHWAEAMHWIT
jgi:hypothetical protein